eukprot:scaffold12289_cov123-Isochrysis_galbana.AAC.3
MGNATYHSTTTTLCLNGSRNCSSRSSDPPLPAAGPVSGLGLGALGAAGAGGLIVPPCPVPVPAVPPYRPMLPRTSSSSPSLPLPRALPFSRPSPPFFLLPFVPLSLSPSPSRRSLQYPISVCTYVWSPNERAIYGCLCLALPLAAWQV